MEESNTTKSSINKGIMIATILAFFLIIVLIALILFFAFNKNVTTETDSQDLAYVSSLFDNNYVHESNITISDSNWEDLLANPTEKTKYKTDVVIDDTKVDNVSFATKGTSSLTEVASLGSDKYSFKINFGKYINGQTYKGLDKLNLNNFYSDATYMKDYIVYFMMQSMGVQAPLAGYSQLYINNGLHGLYLNVEEVEESFLKRNDDENSVLYKPEVQEPEDAALPTDAEQPQQPVKPEQPQGPTAPEQPQEPTEPGQPLPPSAPAQPDGQNESGLEPQPPTAPARPTDSIDSAGADLIYIDDNIDSYASVFDNIVNKATIEDKERLIQALKSLNTNQNIEEYWDMESVISFFAVHNFVLSFDSYTGKTMHNYYLLQKNGKLSIIPWDYNLAFGTLLDNNESQNKNYATRLINWGIDSPLSGVSVEQRPLWNIIATNQNYLEKYHEKLSVLVAKIDDFTEEIDKTTSLINGYVQTNPNPFYEAQGFDSAVQTLETFIQLRAESVKKQISGEIPSINASQDLDASNVVDGSGVDIGLLGVQGGQVR